jgi:hypothetical protein
MRWHNDASENEHYQNGRDDGLGKSGSSHIHYDYKSDTEYSS